MGEFLFWRDKLRAETYLREITQTIGIYDKDTGHLQNLKETSRPQKETGPETQTLLLSCVSDFRFLSLSLSLCGLALFTFPCTNGKIQLLKLTNILCSTSSYLESDCCLSFSSLFQFPVPESDAFPAVGPWNRNMTLGSILWLYGPTAVHRKGRGNVEEGAE